MTKPVERRGDLFYDGEGNLVGFAPDASPADRQRYRMAVRWAAVVSPFAPSPRDTLPDGRTYMGERVGDLRGPDGTASLRGPNGSVQAVDLSVYREDQRVRITWTNLSAPTFS